MRHSRHYHFRWFRADLLTRFRELWDKTGTGWECDRQDECILHTLLLVSSRQKCKPGMRDFLSSMIQQWTHGLRVVHCHGSNQLFLHGIMFPWLSFARNQSALHVSVAVYGAIQMRQNWRDDYVFLRIQITKWMVNFWEKKDTE